MVKGSQVLLKVLYLYAGALIPVILAKLTIIEIDSRTNIVMPLLIFALLISIWLFMLVLGF